MTEGRRVHPDSCLRYPAAAAPSPEAGGVVQVSAEKFFPEWLNSLLPVRKSRSTQTLAIEFAEAYAARENAALRAKLREVEQERDALRELLREQERCVIEGCSEECNTRQRVRAKLDSK
jgi:hypothetical protein